MPGSGAAILTFLIADVRGYTSVNHARGAQPAARLAANFEEPANTAAGRCQPAVGTGGLSRRSRCSAPVPNGATARARSDYAPRRPRRRRTLDAVVVAASAPRPVARRCVDRTRGGRQDAARGRGRL